MGVVVSIFSRALLDKSRVEKQPAGRYHSSRIRASEKRLTKEEKETLNKLFRGS